jgi:hypothetical protein
VPAARSDEASAPDDHLLLFNRPEFHHLNLGPGQCIVRLDHVAEGRLVGSLTGVVDGCELVSGHSAPFGGPDFVKGSVTATAVLAAARDFVDQAATRFGVRTVRIKAKPSLYGPTEEAVQFALFNLGFEVEACELNHHIDLTGLDGVDGYVRRLKPPARRALKHAAGEPFALREAPGDEAWAQGYAILDRNRRSKDRRLKLSLDYVLRIRDTFPGRIRMYLLDHGGQACAAALVYRVKPGRDLVVYWGDADHDLPRSPMNVLVRDLVGVAVAAGTQSLDIGISSVEGVPDQGLIQFKESVGARPRLRLDLVKAL